MKSNWIVNIACVFAFLPGITTAFAQPPDPPPGPPRMMPPLQAALDTDRDGEISGSEIENAAKALKELDQNGDGRLTRDELRPKWAPEARGSRGGPEGRRKGQDSFGGPGREAGRDPARRVERLMELDANDDGKLSADEVPEQLQNMFRRVDADDDGVVTKEELRKISESRERLEGAGRREGGPPDEPGFRGFRGGPEGREGGPPEGFGRETEGRRGPGPGRGGPGQGPEGFRGPGGGPDGFRGPGGGPEGFGGPGGGRARLIDRLFELDTDEDGKLSREELERMPEPPFGRFGGGRQGGGRQESERPARPERPE